MLSWIGVADAIDAINISIPKSKVLSDSKLQRTDSEEVEKWHESQEADGLVDASGRRRHVEYEYKDMFDKLKISDWMREQVVS